MRNVMQPVMEIDDRGTKRWKLYGKPHREDGPAVEYQDGEKHWFINGKHHRENGPAIEYPDGRKKWYIYGESIVLETIIKK